MSSYRLTQQLQILVTHYRAHAPLVIFPTIVDMSVSAGPGEAALRALTPSQLSFLERLPKAELHAHLNGSIPLPLLQDLAREYTPPPSDDAGVGVGVGVEADDILANLQRLQAGSAFSTIDDFFKLFPAIYALTSTPASLKRATRAVLSHFLDPRLAPSSSSTSTSAVAAVVYIELRTTPRETPHMNRRAYLETVLDEIEARSPDAAALIVSLDRRMTPDVAREVLELAVQLRREGRRVVGVDLCGDPTVRFHLLVFTRRGGFMPLPSSNPVVGGKKSAQRGPPYLFMKGG
jgi:adenosine deaminase